MQNYLYARNLQLSVLKVLSTTESVPNAYTVTCPNGAVESVCIGGLTWLLLKLSQERRKNPLWYQYPTGYVDTHKSPGHGTRAGKRVYAVSCPDIVRCGRPSSLCRVIWGLPAALYHHCHRCGCGGWRGPGRHHRPAQHAVVS